nr:ubiquitin recognition factor in ER-associated degradation protein 1 isoform X1 [Dasypus novemcinctus]
MFSFNMFDHPIPRVFQSRFSTQYRCFSVSMLAGPNDRSDVEKGGKIIMPPSALDQLSRLNITYPMLFKLTNKNSDRMTHCGVLEFVADEGICYLPHWMMQNLLLEEGGLVQVESVNLQVATYSKFQPQSPDFLDITNPKAVLENALRNFACLTTGDVIAINYNEKIYELRVMETKPDKAVSIIECDMNVDFDAPLGYKEPERQVPHEESTEGEADHSGYTGELGFRAFSGSGNRLDGKKKGVEPSPSPIKPGDIKRWVCPDCSCQKFYHYPSRVCARPRGQGSLPSTLETAWLGLTFISVPGLLNKHHILRGLNKRTLFCHTIVETISSVSMCWQGPPFSEAWNILVVAGRRSRIHFLPLPCGPPNSTSRFFSSAP